MAKKTNKAVKEISEENIVSTLNEMVNENNSDEATLIKEETKTTKAEKREATFNTIINTAYTKMGNVFELSEESLRVRLAKVLGIAQNNGIYIKGYMDSGEDEKHSFSKVFGKNWNTWQSEQQTTETKGRIVTFSSGSGQNHFIFIIPTESIKVKTLDNKELTISKDNWQMYPIITGRHGRAYNMARILSYQYGLQYSSIPNGKYLSSNSNNYNLELIPSKEGGENWKIFNTKGDLRKLDKQPLEYLTNLSELNKVIGL